MNAIIARQTLAKAMLIAGSLVLGISANAQDNRAANLIVTLEHRSPVTAIQKLSPLLDPRGDIGRIGDKLIINTTASNLIELESALAEFDVPARRLVLSLDPSYGTDGDNDRQSMQALEFDQNEFILTENQITDDAPATESDSNAPTEPVSILRISAEISGSSAMASITTSGIPALSPTYQVSMPLGQWVILEPADQAITLDNSAEASPDGNSTVQAQEPLSETSTSIAIRVDVLP